MNYLTQNIKFLRKREGYTQQQFADSLGINRSVVGAYEEGRAYPKIAIMQQLADQFCISIDELINVDLQFHKSETRKEKQLQILSVVVDGTNNELIPIVPVKASAGYLNGLADPEFIGKLPVFSMPVPELSQERTYRVFQIKGDSMLPVDSGSYIFCEFVASFSEIKTGHSYVIVTREDGIVYKRIYQTEENKLLLVSDNKTYSPYWLGYDAVLEVWKARGVLSFNID